MNGTESDVANGAASDRGGSGPGGEDLDVVLGRFQDWALKLRANPGNAPNPPRYLGADATASSRKPSGEARDVSYEQALRASRYRRPADVPLDPLLEREPGRSTGALQDGQAQASSATFLWESAWTATMRPAEPISTAQSRFTEAVRALTPEGPEASVSKIATGPRVHTTEIKTTEIKTDESAMISETPVRHEVPAVKAVAVEETGIQGFRKPELSSAKVIDRAAIERTAGTPRPPRKQPLAQPAFRDVLKGTAALVAAAQSCGIQERGKSAALTLRVSDGEQARIQVCAARANLSVSAYLRQCALGVDELREQVQMALSTLHERQTRTAPPPGIEAIPGILGRFAKQCWRRMRGASEDYTVVTMR